LVNIHDGGIAIKRREEEPIAAPVTEISPVRSFRVTFLGTAAGFGLQDRTSSGILVQTAGGFIQLDCGVGSYPQIRSHYGRAQAADVLRNMKTIWISHCHIDHIEGLVRMLLERRKVTSGELLLCACQVVTEEVKRIESLFGPRAFNVVYHDRLTPVTIAGVLLESFPVQHFCPGAMGCVLTMGGGERLAFSGDRLCDGQFEAAVGRCDVLIHEGTYTAVKERAAQDRGHSTFDGAAKAATAMGAK
jgi:ribonuclease BN (tRNA processing enzyme)